MRNSLYPVCSKSGKGYVIVEGDSLALFAPLKILQKKRYIWYTFNDDISYIRISLNPVCSKSGKGCVIVEGDSLARFTALKIRQ